MVFSKISVLTPAVGEFPSRYWTSGKAPPQVSPLTPRPESEAQHEGGMSKGQAKKHPPDKKSQGPKNIKKELGQGPPPITVFTELLMLFLAGPPLSKQIPGTAKGCKKQPSSLQPVCVFFSLLTPLYTPGAIYYFLYVCPSVEDENLQPLPLLFWR